MFSSNTSQVSGAANYIEDVFSTYLYTGTGSAQTITNGIDLSTKGGLVWTKSRSNSANSNLVDTARGADSYLISNSTVYANSFTGGGDTAFSFGTTGYTTSNFGSVAQSALNFVSWTFRKQPKFFDVVTYTGSGGTQAIAHNLGSVPGCIIIKAINSTEDWNVYHRSTGATTVTFLNLTNAAAYNANFFPTEPTSTEFYVGDTVYQNAEGSPYIAYIFAHNAGGFGLTGTDNVISCGSVTANGSGAATINLGYEPQWIMLKNITSADSWLVFDNMRGLFAPTQLSPVLRPNITNAEVNSGASPRPSATGVSWTAGDTVLTASNTYIYIAIRRGPMKVPTSGTSVFNVQTGTAGSGTVLTTNMNTDMIIGKNRTGNYWAWGTSKLIGYKQTGVSNNTEWRTTTGTYISAWGNNTVTLGSEGDMNGGGQSTVWYNFTRAPSFFDHVCYTGQGNPTTIAHNLGVVPELIIVKSRRNGDPWVVYHSAVGPTGGLFLEQTSGSSTSTNFWNNTAPTATNVYNAGWSYNGSNGVAYAMYMWATCPGVSKVGSYTGNGSSQTINCGFTSGARFVMIKSITQGYSQSKWYVWDTARGLVSGNDPYLAFNEGSGEGAGLDVIDPDSSGFIVNQVGDAYNPTDTNASGQTYIYLAIA